MPPRLASPKSRSQRASAVRQTGLATALGVLVLGALVSACTSEEEGQPVEVSRRGTAGRAGAKGDAEKGGAAQQAGGRDDDEGGAAGSDDGEGGTGGGTDGGGDAGKGGDDGENGGSDGGASTSKGGSGGSTPGKGGTGGAGGSASGKGGSGGSTSGKGGAGGASSGKGGTSAGTGGKGGAAGTASGGAGSAAGDGGAGGTDEPGGAAGATGTGTGTGGSDAGGSGGSGTQTSCPVTIDPLLTFTLENAAFPGTGHPDAAVHVPPSFDACDHPGLIVFFHGFNNCVVNAIGSTNTACTPGGGTRTALKLADQLDASGANAILVAVEIKFDQATGNPGALTQTGRLRALLDEIFTQSLAAKLGKPLDVAAFDRVVLSSHSGGYWAVAESLQNGGLDNVREIDLYDSLYGEYATYKSFLDDHAAAFTATADPPYRFAMAWTSGGGTADLSVDLQADAQDALDGAGLSSAMLYDPTTGTFTDEDYLHPVIFKRSGLTHDGVPQYYFQRFASVGFAKRP